LLIAYSRWYSFSAQFQEAFLVLEAITNLRSLGRTLCFLSAILWLGSPSQAQVASAELSGNVLDASGAAVVGATVTAINLETTIAHSTASEKRLCAYLAPPGQLHPDGGGAGLQQAGADGH
jgi:hypothetical protein